MNETPNPGAGPSLPPPISTAIVDEPGYKGVGGWLLFFCVSLTILSPAITFVSLARSYGASSRFFSQFHGLLVITVLDTILSTALMAFSIYAGVCLWKVRPGALRTAKTYLFCLLAYFAVAAVLPFMAGLPSAANAAMLPVVVLSSVRGLIYFAIWYSYLIKSKRVQATYAT
jgi:hypothetical protein